MTQRLRGLLHPAALSFVLLTEGLPAEHAALPVGGTAPRRAAWHLGWLDAIAKASKLTLPDGRKLLLKRKGLKLTLAIGDKQGEALLRPLEHGPDVRAIIRQALEAAARAAGARARFEPGAVHLDLEP